MKTGIKLLLTTISLIVFNLFLPAQTPDFSGTWVLNFAKSKLENKNEGLTNQIFVIKQEGDKFNLTIYHFYGDKKKKINFSMIADSETRRIKLIFKGKLEKTEDGLRATMWRSYYLNVVNYKFGANQNELIADEVFTGKPKDHHSIWVFDKEVSK